MRSSSKFKYSKGDLWPIKLNIPIISILDTNCNPNLVDIPIPANDDAVKSIKLILSKLSDGIIAGQGSKN